MVHKALKGCHIVTFGLYKPGWEPIKIKEWVANAGGTTSTTLTDKATHVVMQEKTWKAQGQLVNEVKERRAKGQQLHILKYEWLEDSLQKKSKLSEAKFSWEREDKKGGGDGKGGPRSTAGLMSDLFEGSTEQYIDPREVERMRKKRDAEQKAAKEEAERVRLEFEKKRDSIRIKEVAAIFRRGAQRAKHELLSDNHHIYTDKSGFALDVVLTKVDTSANKNQRYTLTIYESNSQPHTYAFNAQHAGTGIDKKNNIIAAVGATWATAFHAFKKVFKEHTGVNWEDRVTAALTRHKHEKAKPAEQGEEDLNSGVYLYHPPMYGPRGQDVMPAQESSTPAADDHDGTAMDGAKDPGSASPKGQTPVQIDDHWADADQFRRETKDYNAPLPEDLVDDAFKDPFDFGTFESADAEVTDPASGEAEGDQDQNKDVATEEMFATTEMPAVNFTQLADEARDGLMEMIQHDEDDVVNAGGVQETGLSSSLGKRKAQSDDCSDGESLPKKAKTSNNEADTLQLGSSCGNFDVDYDFSAGEQLLEGQTPRMMDQNFDEGEGEGEVDFSAFDFDSGEATQTS